MQANRAPPHTNLRRARHGYTAARHRGGDVGAHRNPYTGCNAHTKRDACTDWCVRC